MMKLRKILSVVIVLGLTTIGLAQQRSHKEWNPEQRATHKVERFSKTTEISKDKQEKLIQVLTESQEKRKALREQENVTKEERKALRKEHTERVNEVLETKELIKAWREFNEAERQKRRRYMKHKRNNTKENQMLKERLEKE